jgi:tetratricopeptide (TPR) repeat protein
VSFFSLLLVCSSAIQGHEGQKSVASSQKVTLRWKFEPNQVFLGKLASGLRTLNDYPQRTSYAYDFQWKVQSLDEKGGATVKMVIQRHRFRHRSDKVKVDYDSDSKAGFSPSEIELSEINWILKFWRKIQGKEFIFRFSDRGEVKQVESYDAMPAQLIRWPELPEQPVGVGDTWTNDASQRDPARFELVRIEEFDGETIAWIEDKSSTMRFRFLVNEGRYLDKASWDILSTRPGEKKSYVQHISQRLRLELAEDKGRFDRLRALQPNQVGRSLDLITESYKQTKSIEEFLIDEKKMLAGILERLWIEHVDKLELSDKNKWNGFDWLWFARYHKRIGDVESYKKLLKDGAEATSLNSAEHAYIKNTYLLQFADLLADIGEFEAAKKTCLEISHDAMSGFSVTSQGPLNIPRSTLRDYAFLLVARKQAKAGLIAESTSLARLITRKSYRSAANWVIAMHLAEQGNIKAAVDTVAIAEEFYSEGASIIEFDTNGPVEVPVHNYRTLGLGKLAICQAKQNDENAMRETLALIKDDTEKRAVLVDLIIALDKDGMSKLADKLSAESPESTRAIATTMRISMRLKSNAMGELERMIESIREPEWNAANRMEYCMALRSDNMRASELQRQLDLAGVTIRKISEPQAQLPMIIRYASILSKLGRQKEAQVELKTALEIVDRAKMDQPQRLEMLFEMAEVSAKVADAAQFENLMIKIESMLESQDESQKARNQLLVVKIYLDREEMSKAEVLAERIKDASYRCQALAAVGNRYGQLLELERSREVFAKAYESALQVVDVLGLDTVYSKGGALRFIGQQQGECDLEGFVNFVEESTNANIRAYGLLGGVESIDPVAAEQATHVVRIPEGILKEVCESNVACQILEGRVQLLDDYVETNEKQDP